MKKKSSQNVRIKKPTYKTVTEIDTKGCLSKIRRVVRKPALPEVPELPWGPFLN